MVLELFMEAVWCFTEAETNRGCRESERECDGERKMPYGSVFSRAHSCEGLPSDCWRAEISPSDPHHSPSLPPPRIVRCFLSALTVSDKKIVL